MQDVSVIIPNFNGKKYLKECLDEVREQIVCVISHEPYISQMIWDLAKRNERVPMGSIHKIEIDQ